MRIKAVFIELRKLIQLYFQKGLDICILSNANAIGGTDTSVARLQQIINVFQATSSHPSKMRLQSTNTMHCELCS